jgi:hypothetical protein
MSADNGVYILASRGPKKRRGYTKEYRVVHAQAIDNITWQPDYPAGNGESELNQKYVLLIFGNARVFTDRRIAEGYAQCLYDELVGDDYVVEYGTCFLDYAHIRFPKKQEARSRDQSRTVVG